MQQLIDAPPGPWGARPVEPEGGVALRSVGAGGLSVPSVDRPVFVGSRRRYARLMLSGLLLYIPTFGFNRFWLKTDQRRFYWLNTTLGGDSFDYRGTARELIVGFLYAIAIYMPIAALYSLAGLYAESYQAYASLPFAIFTIAFTHYAAFRARRYRLTRTAFRGIRFWMRGGSGWRMGLGAFLWLLLTGLTLGLAYFWMQAWLERYKMRYSSYGDLPGRFEGSGWGLLRAYGIPGFLIVLITLGFLGWLGYVAFATMFSGSSARVNDVAWLVAPFLLMFFVPAAWSVLTVIKTRWWLSGVRFGAVSLHTSMRSTAMVVPALKTTFVALLAVSLWSSAAYAILRFYVRWQGVSNAEFFSDVGSVVLLLLLVTAALVILMFVKAVFYNLDFVKRVCAATVVSGLEAVPNVSAGGSSEGIVGEGLADALGADGF